MRSGSYAIMDGSGSRYFDLVFSIPWFTSHIMCDMCIILTWESQFAV